MEKDKKFIIFVDILALLLSLAIITFIVIDMVNIIPLFKAFSYDSTELEFIISDTQIGKIILGINATEQSGIIKMVTAAVLSFIKNAHFMAIIFLCFIIFIYFIKFYHTNWKYEKDLNSYLKIYKWVSIVYILKYILSAAMFGLFYNGTTQSYFNSFFAMPFVHVIANVILIVLLFLPIVRFFYKLKTLENR